MAGATSRGRYRPSATPELPDEPSDEDTTRAVPTVRSSARRTDTIVMTIGQSGRFLAFSIDRFSVVMFLVVLLVAMLFTEDSALLPRRCIGLLVCVMLALEAAGLLRSDRTYKLSSLLFCAGLAGGQSAALLTRTLSSVTNLRATTEQLRSNSILGVPFLTIPPFAILGLACLFLGAVLGVQPLPLVRRLHVALVELVLFAISAVVVYVRIEEEDVLTHVENSTPTPTPTPTPNPTSCRAGQRGPSGWWAEAGRSLGQPETCSAADRSRQRASWSKAEPASFFDVIGSHALGAVPRLPLRAR